MTAMAIRIVVADGPELNVPPEPWVRLRDLVREAAPLVTDEDVEFVRPGDYYPDDRMDAALYEAGVRYVSPMWPPPTVQVTIRADGSAPVYPPLAPTHDSITVNATDVEGGVRSIADWLHRHLEIGLDTDERKRVEVVVREVLHNIHRGAYDDKDPDEVAQAQAAVETVNAQLRAPRPSRRIVGWALGQLPGFVLGSLSGVSGNYLTELLKMLT
jgi:hypothetical protein